MENVFLLINIVCSAMALPYSIWAVNSMSCMTHHGIRIAYVSIAIGSMATIISPIFPDAWHSPIAATPMYIGIALWCVFGRRRKPAAMSCPVVNKQRPECLLP